MRMLADAGVPTSSLIAPIIPAINDHEIETILDAVAAAGADQARYIFLRLPHELDCEQFIRPGGRQLGLEF